MLSFAELKRNREASLANQIAEVSKTSSFVNHDAKCWKPKLNAEGKGYAVIRFLAAPVFLSEAERNWVKIECFNMKRVDNGKTKYYIENSLKSTGAAGVKVSDTDPADTLKWALWNQGSAADKAASKFIKNRSQYYANIRVITHTGNPSDEGKVFPYKFGQQIFGKIQNALTPEFPDEPRFDPFDIWESRDFIVKIVTDEASKLPDYEASKFADVVTPLAATEEEIERIWMSQESVLQWVAPDKFKSEEALLKGLKYVLGYSTIEEYNELNGVKGSGNLENFNNSFEIEDAPKPRQKPEAGQAATQTPRAATPPKQAASTDASMSEDDEFLKQFGSFDDDEKTE